MLNRTTLYAYLRRAPFGGKLTQQQIEGTESILSAWDAEVPDDATQTDFKKLAYVLATVFHETGGKMVPVREGFAKSDAAAIKIVKARSYGKPDAVIDPMRSPKLKKTGKVYYGRGQVQLTWAENYDRIGKRVGAPLLTNPDLMLNPQISATVAVKGMLDGLFTGRRLSDYFNPKGANPRGARAIINGQDKAGLVEDHYNSILAALLAADEQSPQPKDVTPDSAQPDGPEMRSDKTTTGMLTAVAGSGVFGALSSVNSAWAFLAFLVLALGAYLYFTGRFKIRKEAGA